MSLQASLNPPSRFPVTGFLPPGTEFVGEFPSISYARSMRDFTDEELMQRYGAGEARAFEALYPRYRESLYRYFLRHVTEPAVANDLYQGCWEKVIKARQSYQRSSPFRGWLFRIAHNHMIDHFRAYKPTQPLDHEREADNSNDPVNKAVQAEQGAQFLQQIALLPAEQRDALLLHFESGLGLEQIGEITGVAGETVKSRLRYATRKLKQALTS